AARQPALQHMLASTHRCGIRGDAMTRSTRARITLVVAAVRAGVLSATTGSRPATKAAEQPSVSGADVHPTMITTPSAAPSPLAVGKIGRLGFSYGNAAQDEGAAAAEFAYKTKHWKTATIVTDDLLRYFQDVCKAFTVRFQQLGGKIVAQEHFTQFKNQINSVVSRVNNEKSDAIAFCTSFGVDQPAFVSGLRSLNNQTPIINGWASDGAY